MKKMIFGKTGVGLMVLFLLLAFSRTGVSQEIMLDKMEKCVDLICYPGMDDPNTFYYLPDQPRLAYKDGKPQFSFLKYARTQETGKAGIGRAEGGGIIHFLVTYGVSKSRIQAAERELQERHPDAKILGPIVYRKGHFALITSFKQGNETTTKTVAVGKAPLMEGQKTAVSMALTREGAELLWESFQTDTPDISLVFDMEFTGIREPYEATLEADWSRVSKHDHVKAGLKYKWFGADVDILLQELRQTGAIKITTKGTNAVMDNILQSANEKLLKAMFDPAPADDLTRAAAEKNSYDNLNQAVKLLKDAAGSSGKSSDGKKSKSSLIKTIPESRIAGEGCDRIDTWAVLSNAFFPKAYADFSSSVGQSSISGSSVSVGEDTIEPLDDTQVDDSTVESQSSVASALLSASEAYNRARRLDEEARKEVFSIEATRKAINAYEMYQAIHQPTGERAREIEGRIRMLKVQLEVAQTTEGEDAGKAGSDTQNTQIPEDESRNAGGAEPSKTDKTTLDPPESAKNPSTPESETSPSKAAAAAGKKPESDAKSKTNKASKTTAAEKARAAGDPGFSLVASYQMKRIKRTGKMVYHMNHYRTETQAFAMAENIGPIYKKYGNDARIFRAVTIDDPVFKQREILVTLDGQDTDTFSKYLNFVTVKMKKRHQAGDTTTGEIVITPETFNASGNHFSMTYGWKDDNDRTAWLNYHYQAIWSFHGGIEIRTPWTETDSPMLALSPPHRYRSISIEGDGETLSDADVRHGVISLNCRIGDKFIPQQVTIRNNSAAPSLILDIPEDPDNPETLIDITWYLKKNRKLCSAQTKLEGDIIYWDELPKGGI